MKKGYPATFKAQAVLDVLKDEYTIPQLAVTYGVAPTVLRDWRAVALKGAPDRFTARDSVAAVQATHAHQREALSGDIGRLTTQRTFLKKSVPRYTTPNGGHWWTTTPMPYRFRCKPSSWGSVAVVSLISRSRHRRRRWQSNSALMNGILRTPFMAHAS